MATFLWLTHAASAERILVNMEHISLVDTEEGGRRSAVVAKPG